MQVFDDEHERALRGLGREEAGDEIEQEAPVVVGHRPGRAQLREQPGEVRFVAVEHLAALDAQQVAEHRRERRERQTLLAQLEAVAGEHAGARGAGERVNSATRRVLPTPASPPTSTAVGSSSRARLKASRSAAYSAARPTRTEPVRRVVTS